jgi:uncharacterized membrane protein
MDRTGIPTDGPEAALARVGRRLHIRYSNTYVARQVARHPQPNSLLALVEVAPELGLKVMPGRTDASELARIDGPAILHFDGGFGVLEGVSAEGFKVWDSKKGSRTIEGDRFLRFWSGIVVLVERDEQVGGREDGFVRNRLLETFFGSLEPPAVVASRYAPMLRIALGAVLASLLAVASATLPVEARLAAGTLTLLSILGLAVTVIAGISIAAQNSPLADRICARGKYVNCQSVLSSRYSRVLGFPLSDIGIALYGSVLLLVATGVVGGGSAGIWSTIALVFVITVPFSLVLIGVQLAMRQICTLCLAVHAVNLSSAAVAWLWLEPGTVPLGETIPILLLFSLFYSLLLFFAIPFFRKHQGMAVLARIHGRISGSPFASLAEILAEAPIGERPSGFAVPLGGSEARHDLTVFVHPSCNKCNSVFAEVTSLVQAGLVSASVGLAPKDPEESDRRACSAVVAAGIGGVPLDAAYTAAKKQMRAMAAGDPVGALGKELDVDRAAIEPHLGRAREMVVGAEKLVDEHAEGTPAVFIDSRIFRGELTHLAFLLQQHPDLLEPVVLARDGGQDVAVSR